MNRTQDAAIVTVGTELTEGLRYDTNSRDVARVLIEHGYAVRILVSVPDDENALADTLRQLLASHELVVVTGGLGPTHDDITRQAAARALGRALQRDPDIAALLSSVADRQREPSAAERTLRQADVVEGARSLAASNGTAPGMVIDTDQATLLLLPGPPGEMRPMLDVFLEKRSPGIVPIRLRCFGITESDAQARVEPVIEKFPGVSLTLLAGLEDLEVILLSRGASADDLTAAASAVRTALGQKCFSENGSSLAETVLNHARRCNLYLASAESCTGGLIAASLTSIPGASDVFKGGAVAYSNDFKCRLLGVNSEVLSKYGAVSSEVALSMAEGALQLPSVDIAVSTTGIAGPTGGTRTKPVGLVWFGIAAADGSRIVTSKNFFGGREAIRTRATATALDFVRRFIEDRHPCVHSSR